MSTRLVQADARAVSRCLSKQNVARVNKKGRAHFGPATSVSGRYGDTIVEIHLSRWDGQEDAAGRALYERVKEVLAAAGYYMVDANLHGNRRWGVNVYRSMNQYDEYTFFNNLRHSKVLTDNGSIIDALDDPQVFAEKAERDALAAAQAEAHKAEQEDLKARQEAVLALLRERGINAHGDYHYVNSTNIIMHVEDLEKLLGLTPHASASTGMVES